MSRSPFLVGRAKPRFSVLRDRLFWLAHDPQIRIVHVPLLLLEVAGDHRRQDVAAIRLVNPVAVAAHHDIAFRPVANELITPLARKYYAASIVCVRIPIHIFDSCNLSFLGLTHSITGVNLEWAQTGRPR